MAVGRTPELIEASPEIALGHRALPQSRLPGLHLVAGGVISVLVLGAIFAPLIAPQPPNEIDLSHTLAGPSGAHIFGQDNSGRDILSRIIFGARSSLGGPALVVLISTFVGVPLGLLAGYTGGIVDSILGRVWDVMLAFPALLLAIVIVATFGTGFWTATIAIAITYVPLMARIVRGVVLVEREKPYVAAARLQGFRASRVALAHVLPNVSTPVLAQVTLNFGYALLDLAALSFIGLGIQPPSSDWGTMLADGKTALLETANPVIWPSMMIVITVVSFNLLGDGVAQRMERSR